VEIEWEAFRNAKVVHSLLTAAWDRVLFGKGKDKPDLRVANALKAAGIDPQTFKSQMESYEVDKQIRILWKANAETGFFEAARERELARAGLTEFALEYLKYANPERRGSEPPTRYIADANDAELAAAEFMRWLGFPDAQASPVGPDGGIDVSSKQAVGQVKDYGKPIGRPELQQHLGVAVGEGGKLPVFFARSGYTNQALEWGNERDMPLYEFDLAGSWAPSNSAGELLWSAGADRFLKNRGLEGVQSPPEDIVDPPAPPRLEEQGAAEAQDLARDSSEQEEEPTISSEESGAGLAAEIRALADLRDSGVLDDEEFRLAKKKLLD
jgi:hypothetical protein